MTFSRKVPIRMYVHFLSFVFVCIFRSLYSKNLRLLPTNAVAKQRWIQGYSNGGPEVKNGPDLTKEGLSIGGLSTQKSRQRKMFHVSLSPPIDQSRDPPLPSHFSLRFPKVGEYLPLALLHGYKNTAHTF